MDQVLTYHQPTGLNYNTQKASHDAQHSICLVCDFLCITLSISIDPHTDVPQLWAVIFQSSAPQLWQMPQKSHHENEIWWSNCHVWQCWGNTCSPWHCFPGYHTNHSQHIGTRQWNKCQAQWGLQPLKGSGTVAGTLPASSDKTQSIRTYHQTTCIHWELVHLTNNYNN